MMDPASSSSSESQDAKNDRALIEATIAGSQTAFEALVLRHQDRIFRLLSRFTREPAEVEDLAQDVFLKAFRRLHTFQFNSQFYTWLYRIAVNTASDGVQRRRRNPVQAVENPGAFETSDVDSGPPQPDRILMEGELQRATREVLARLPEKYRQILVLREYEDLSYDEIAATLGCALGTVESRLFRAREKFKEILESEYPEFGQGI